MPTETLKKYERFPRFTRRVSEMLAVDPGVWLDRALAAWFNKNFDAYDRAIDAVYNATHIGGSQAHHLVDGNHSLAGAIAAAQKALPGDTYRDAVANALEHLGRDLFSVSGINPFLQLDVHFFTAIKSGLKDYVGISAKYVNDILTLNGSESVVSVLGFASLSLVHHKRPAEETLSLATALGVAALYAGNPLMGSGAAFFIFRSWPKTCRGSKRVVTVLKSGTKTAVTVSVMNALGGPLTLALLGLTVIGQRFISTTERDHITVKDIRSKNNPLPVMKRQMARRLNKPGRQWFQFGKNNGDILFI